MTQAAGIAYALEGPQPGMAPSHRKSDAERYESAWHAAHCTADECDHCHALCRLGLVISCDGCGHVHHTDWLGWCGHVDEKGQCSVLCPECQSTKSGKDKSAQHNQATGDKNAR